jgi:hypothetical protein
MKPVQIPNLPTKDVKVVILDARAPQEMKDMLNKHGITIVQTLAHPDVYSSVAYHPDIMLHHVIDNIVVYAPNTPEKLLTDLNEIGLNMIKGETFLRSKYPNTIAYNIARVGKYAFHNTKYTDPVVKELLNKYGIQMVNVNQGYSKCLTCVVDQNSIITSDMEIYRNATAVGLDVLLIEPDSTIKLEPFDMGFIGGATGLIGKNKLALAGDLKFHKNSEQIMKFLSLKDVHMVMLNDDMLLDLGSIIPILEA